MLQEFYLCKGGLSNINGKPCELEGNVCDGRQKEGFDVVPGVSSHPYPELVLASKQENKRASIIWGMFTTKSFLWCCR